jgi:thioesterase domain-containing protein/acyl carrier protein
MTYQPEIPSEDKPRAAGYESIGEPAGRSSVEVASPATAAPSNEVESVLTRWWQDLLGLDSVGVDDDFFDLGGHSLIGVQLFSRIKQTYGVELGLSTLFDARTVRQLAELINQTRKPAQAVPEPWSPVVPIQANGQRTPLFLVPGGYGTTVLPFREVSLLLGPDQPVFGLEAQMPPENEEMESIPARAARFVGELRSRQPNGPYFLLGWCGGGYVAYEMAQKLVAAGQEVAFLAIVECADPQHPRSLLEGTQFRAQRIVWRIRNFMKRGPKGIAVWAGQRAAGLFSGRTAAKRPKTQVTPLPAESMDEVDARAWRNVYRYHPTSYPGKSVVIIGNESWKYNGVSRASDPRLFWCKYSRGGSEVRVIPGDHMSMLKAPSSVVLARELRESMDKALAKK